MHCNTIDRERFARLNIRGFSIIKVFTEILSCCLGHNAHYLVQLKRKNCYSWKNFRTTPENHEKCKSLAQQIFPCLWYFIVVACDASIIIHPNNMELHLHCCVMEYHIRILIIWRVAINFMWPHPRLHNVP